MASAHLASSAPAAQTLDTLTERCTFVPVAQDGVRLTTRFKLESVGGLPTKVSLIPGWNIGRQYPKAPRARLIRLQAGETQTFIVTRTILHVPALRNSLRRGPKPRCASIFSVARLRE